MNNIILLTDSYKGSHYLQYPPGTENVYSYFESRGDKDVVFFGLQYYLKKYLAGCVVTAQKIREAWSVFQPHMGDFNWRGWNYILNKHQGFLPISIKAVPEGSVIPGHNVLFTIENTDPKCYWLTNYLESLLVQVWYGCTVATQSREMKKILLSYLEKTGDPSTIDFKLHDFGFRGVSSPETAGVGAAAHLLSFRGTDTLAGVMMARQFYNCPMAGFSIPAAEHSTITSWGVEHEVDAYENMLDQFPTGAVAIVSDSYDIYNACQHHWGETLKDKVLKRDGVTIIRPDSGDATVVIPRVLDILGQQFGYTVNTKIFKILNPKIRVIQGDGIDIDSLQNILQSVVNKRWSADNIGFGSGGGLLQKLNRDTYKFALKCSSVVVNGEQRKVFKDPITDLGKRSKRGRMQLIKIGNEYATVSEDYSGQDELKEVFRDGELLIDQDFDTIRSRI